MIGPPTFFALRARGFTLAEAVGVDARSSSFPGSNGAAPEPGRASVSREKPKVTSRSSAQARKRDGRAQERLTPSGLLNDLLCTRGIGRMLAPGSSGRLGVYPPPVTSLRTLLETALARLVRHRRRQPGRRGDARRKALLVLVSVLILPVSLLWGGLYVALGAPSGVLAFVYFVVSVGAIAVFARTRDFALFLRVELLDILLAPNLSMIPLGGFITSTGVGIWGILAPMGALVFERRASRHPLVRRVPGGLPRVRPRGRDPGHHLAAAGVVHDPDAGAQHRRRRDDRVHAARAVRQAAAGRADGPARSRRTRPRTCSSTSCRGRSPSG